MGSLSLKAGLLLVFIPAATAFAAGDGQDDRSYLPPAQFVSSQGAAPVPNDGQAAAEPKGRQAQFGHRRYGHGSHSRRNERPFLLPF